MVRGERPTVHVLVGLPAAGKTTCAKAIAAEYSAVRFSLDEWMLRLYGLRFDDDAYVERLPACRALILDTAASVLDVGVDVVLDWNHWSPERRAASAAWAGEHDADYLVHHVVASLDLARAQLARRNAAGDDASHVIDADELQAALTYFVAPTAEEGHVIRTHKRS